jgi:hypothetical protein
MDVVPIGATTLETQGLEVDPATGKLKEAATYLLQTLVPGKHNAAQRLRAAGKGRINAMNPSVNDVLNCLQKYDEGHRDFYQRYAEVLTAKLHTAFQNITNVICTEDPNISGTRVDAYVETPTEKYLIEAKLCMSSGATLGRKLLKKAATTLNKLGIQEAVLLLIVPQQHLSAAERLLKDYIARAVYGHTDEKLDQNDLALAPRLGEVTLVLKAKKKYKALHDTLSSYGVKEIAVLPI